MSLKTYREKRDFDATPEPRGRKAAKAGHLYVIQKHAARRLHYDLRLELDGVLKSWAVTRGPSLDPADKRLAVEVEDHPLDYGSFEGTIPKGEYGGGTVIVWDRGTWQPVGDPHEGLAKGHLEFELDGEKLKGRWHLVRMAPKPREKRVNWLLIKAEDAAARDPDDPPVTEALPLSVKTGRAIDEVAADAGRPAKTRAKARAASGDTARKSAPATPKADTFHGKIMGKARPKGARKVALPAFIPPMLATLAANPPAGAGYVHEIKFDGYRLPARIDDGAVRLLTRGGLDWTQKFGPGLAEAFAGLSARSAFLDGELVVETASGVSDFSALQHALSEGETGGFVFYAFDLLFLDGVDLRAAPLLERKALLEALLNDAPPTLRFSRHFTEDGARVLAHACGLGLEGIVSKRTDGPYRSGRTRDWIKTKCAERQEFVVAGYAPSTATRGAIGSLLLGVHEARGLMPVGRVGTGFTAQTARDLYRRLDPLPVAECPFAVPLSAQDRRNARFVRPDLLAEVTFRGWTADGHLRHASFQGLRDDKPAKEVVREMPKTEKPNPGAAPPAASAEKARGRVAFTHPERLYWPGDGITKEKLADYHLKVWAFAAPHLVSRPLALVRCPEGIDGPRFFQKHVWQGARRAILPVKDPTDPDGAPLVAIKDADGLMGLVQAAALEIHPWGSTLSNWEAPDRIVMDLDPGEGVAWKTVIAAAREVAARLEEAGLATFVKTTGGKGLHVVAPLTPKARWPRVKAFTKAVAQAMAADSPDRYVATIAKAKRKGKILIDYLRNQRGATAVAPYSPRAREGAPVSMPIAWDALDTLSGPQYFTVENTPDLLAGRTRDPWADFADAARPLDQRPGK